MGDDRPSPCAKPAEPTGRSRNAGGAPGRGRRGGRAEAPASDRTIAALRHFLTANGPRLGNGSRRGGHRSVTELQQLAAMRVLYCTDTYPPQVNGVSIVTALSVAGLTRLGWECAVVAPQYSEVAEHGGRAEVLSSPSVPLPRYPEIRVALPRVSSVSELIDRFRPDLVHCETEFSSAGRGRSPRAGGPSAGVLLSHRLRPVRRGVRGTLAAGAGVALSPPVSRPEPAGVHAVERVAQDAAVAGTLESGRRGLGPRGGHRAVPPGPPEPGAAGRVRHGEPVHLPLCRAAGAGEAGRAGRRCLSARERDAAQGSHPSHAGRHGTLRSRPAEGGAAGRHLSRLAGPAVASARSLCQLRCLRLRVA